MKLETTHGEAREIVVGQVKATAEMLLRIVPLLENGQVKIAYKECNFDLMKRMAENLEAYAADQG